MKDNLSKNKENRREIKSAKSWAIKITFITFCLSLLFALLAQFAANVHIAVLFIVLIILIAINILFDGVAVAITASDIVPFNSMASKKIKYAKSAIYLIKNAEKVASICADVIGDIAGIVSGACGAGIIAKIILLLKDDPKKAMYSILLSILMTAIISALTVGGKAIMKKYAMNNSEKYIMNVAKLISIFKSENKVINKKKKNKNKKRSKEL